MRESIYTARANFRSIDDLRFKTGLKIQPTLASERQITQAIDRILGGGEGYDIGGAAAWLRGLDEGGVDGSHRPRLLCQFRRQPAKVHQPG